MRASSFCIVLSMGLLATGVACTTASTVGENPDNAGGAGTGANGSSGSSSGSSGPGTPPPVAPTDKPVDPGPPDTKGVVAVTVKAEQVLGAVDLSGNQPGITAVRVVLRDLEVSEVFPAGTPGTCATRVNNPNATEAAALDIPITLSAKAGGKTQPFVYDAKSHVATAAFVPVLADGTPITVTFGPEVPALSGKTVTLPAATTTFTSPVRKPHAGVRELRGWTPGGDFTMTWSSVAGKKFLMAAEGGTQIFKLVDCFPADAATSYAIPAAMMDTIMPADPDTTFPMIYLRSYSDVTENIGTIKVSKRSTGGGLFQLNLNP